MILKWKDIFFKLCDDFGLSPRRFFPLNTAPEMNSLDIANKWSNKFHGNYEKENGKPFIWKDNSSSIASVVLSKHISFHIQHFNIPIHLKTAVRSKILRTVWFIDMMNLTSNQWISLRLQLKNWNHFEISKSTRSLYFEMEVENVQCHCLTTKYFGNI